MAKNVILLDKDGNQLAPATTATQAKYSNTVTVKDKIDELNDRIDHIGGGTVEPLNVTANGTYSVPSGGTVAGYNPVTVDVPPSIPDSELLYDLKVENGAFVETINGLVPTDYANISLANDNIVGTNNNAYLTNKVSFSPCEYYKIELTFDEYNVADESTLNDLNTLVCFGNNANSHYGLRYSKSNAKWYLSTGSNTTSDILFADENYNYFSNKTLEIYVNCNTFLVKDIGNMSYKCGTDIAKPATNYLYTNNYLQLYYAAYSWRACQIPIKGIKVYKLNNVTDQV